MFERYTERARRVLFFARWEASQLGHRSITPEHLLLGLVREGKGLTSRLFTESKLTLDSVQTEIAAQFPFEEPIPVSVEIPFEATTKRILEFCAEESDRLSRDYIGTEHVLLGILREENSAAATILRTHGLTLQDVRQQIADETRT